MNECLVTKLKGSVSADFPRLNEIILQFQRTVNPDGITTVRIATLKEVTCKIIGDGNFVSETGTNIGKMTTGTGNVKLFITSNVTAISVTNKRDIVALGHVNIAGADYVSRSSPLTPSNRLEDFKYLNISYMDIAHTQISGDISALAEMKSMSSLLMSNTQVSGDISALAGLTALKTLSMSSTQVSGNISALAGLTALSSLTLPYTQIFGDISVLTGMKALSSLSMIDTQVSGDISALATLTALKTLSLSYTQVSGNISALAGMKALIALSMPYTQVSGNISTLAGMKTLVSLSLANTQVSGDILALAEMKSLDTLSLSNTQITGDISALAGMTSLNALAELKYLNLRGDLSTLANSVRFISNTGGSSEFSWSAKGTRNNILACENVKIVSGADQFLIDMASCSLNPPSSNALYKAIKITANVTTAANAAIATLQGKGVTVAITPF